MTDTPKEPVEPSTQPSMPTASAVSVDSAVASTAATYTLDDKIWVAVILVALTLFGLAIPLPFDDPRLKNYFVPLATWLLAGGAFNNWFKRWFTATDLLALSGHRPLRAAAVALIPACLVFIVNIVKVDAKLQPGTTLAVKNGPQNASSFWTGLKHLDADVKERGTGRSRRVSLSLGDMLAARLHPTPDWRLVHEVVFACLECPIGTRIRARLKDGAFDTELMETLKHDGVEIADGKTAVITLPRTHEVELTAGQYVLEFVSAPGTNINVCRLDDLDVTKTPTVHVIYWCP